MDRVPFAHPAHVPALLALLRRQSAINALLRSCVAAAVAPERDSRSRYRTFSRDLKRRKTDLSAPLGPVSRLYELRPESEVSFSVTFQRPRLDSLAVRERLRPVFPKRTRPRARRANDGGVVVRGNNGLCLWNLVWDLFLGEAV